MRFEQESCNLDDLLISRTSLRCCDLLEMSQLLIDYPFHMLCVLLLADSSLICSLSANGINAGNAAFNSIETMETVRNKIPSDDYAVCLGHDHIL